MGRDRRTDKIKQKTKIPLNKQFNIKEENILDTLKIYHNFKLTGKLSCESLFLLKKVISEDILNYFTIIGIMEFTKRYYGDNLYE